MDFRALEEQPRLWSTAQLWSAADLVEGRRLLALGWEGGSLPPGCCVSMTLRSRRLQETRTSGRTGRGPLLPFDLRPPPRVPPFVLKPESKVSRTFRKVLPPSHVGPRLPSSAWPAAGGDGRDVCRRAGLCTPQARLGSPASRSPRTRVNERGWRNRARGRTSSGIVPGHRPGRWAVAVAPGTGVRLCQAGLCWLCRWPSTG